MALNLGEMYVSLALRDRMTETLIMRLARAAAEMRTAGSAFEAGAGRINRAVQDSISSVEQLTSDLGLRFLDLGIAAVTSLARVNSALLGVGRQILSVINIASVFSGSGTGLISPLKGLVTFAFRVISATPGLTAALGMLARGMLSLIGAGPHVRGLAGIVIRSLTSMTRAVGPFLRLLPGATMSLLAFIRASGGLVALAGHVQTVGAVFSWSMGAIGVASRAMSTESGRSTLKVIVSLALLVAAVIVARKVITGQMGAIRGAFLAFSPVGLALYSVMGLISRGFAKAKAAAEPAISAVRSGLTSMGTSLRDSAAKAREVGQEFVGFARRLQSIRGVFTTLAGFARNSSNVVRGAFTLMTSGAMAFGQATLTMTPMVLGASLKAGAMLAGLGSAGVAAAAAAGLAFAGLVAGIGVIGIKAAMESAKVKAAFADLRKSAKADLAKAASGLEGPLTKAAGSLKSMFSDQVAPALQGMFNRIAPLIGKFTAGLGAFLKPMLPAIQAVVGAVVPMMSALAGSLGTFGGQLAGFLQPLTAAFVANRGLLANLVVGLGALLQALGPLLGALVTLGAQLMGPLLGGLTSVAGALSTALGPTLTGLGPQIGQIVGALGNMIVALVPLLPPILQLAAAFATALMPTLTQIAMVLTSTLRPVLTALQPMLVMIAQAFGQLVTALLPLLPPVASLVTQLVTALVPAITPLIPIVGQIAGALGGVLVQAVTILVGAITPLLPPISQMAQLFGQAILTAVQQLSPLITQFATLFGQLLTAVLPILPPIMQLATALIPPLVQLVQALAPYMIKLASGITTVVGALAPFLPPLIELGSSVLPLAISLLTALAKILSGDVQGALNTIKAAFTKFGTTVKSAFTKLMSLGKDLVDGIRNGFVNAWNGFVSSVGNLFTGFITWIKGLLGIHSPSTVMAGIGSDTAKGWVLGLLGEESKIKETAGKLTDVVVRAFKAGKISAGVRDHLVEAVRSGNAELQKLAQERERIAKSLADAMAYVGQVSDNLKQFASLGNMNLGQDNGQGKQPVTASAIQSGLQAKLAKVRAFATVIKKLAKRGLSKSLLAQVVEAGPEAGAELGQALLEADSATFKSINSTQGAIDKAAKQAAKNAADAMFDAGKNAGKGFLTGLISQKKAIEAAMKDIANALVAQVKKALKIKSPSQVFAAIGGHTMTGLMRGMVGSSPAVLASAQHIAGQLVRGFNPQLGVGSTGQRAQPGRPGGPVTVHVTNHYPQAEPTSRTVNRGLQYAAMVGLV
ncbi:hypothetical protein ABZ470_39525 [Streptosporangium sp. NPDC020072]|uniref:phage tail protein n=1 Tax=Streptosporangium sp. NPDC020072 TaxID=3154788 RepID=UPI00341C6D61